MYIFAFTVGSFVGVCALGFILITLAKKIFRFRAKYGPEFVFIGVSLAAIVLTTRQDPSQFWLFAFAYTTAGILSVFAYRRMHRVRTDSSASVAPDETGDMAHLLENAVGDALSRDEPYIEPSVLDQASIASANALKAPELKGRQTNFVSKNEPGEHSLLVSPWGSAVGDALSQNEPEDTLFVDTASSSHYGAPSTETPIILDRVQPKLSQNFVNKHWRGGYSLPVAYWAIGVAGTIATLLIIAAVTALVETVDGFQPVLLFLALVTIFLSVMAVWLWQSVGLWRTAQTRANHAKNQLKTDVWPRAAQLAVVLGAFQMMAVASNNYIPMTKELFRVAFMGDPEVSEFQVRITNGGTDVFLSGGIKQGLFEEIQSALRLSPTANFLRLSSEGGRVTVARQIAQLVQSYDLSTDVRDFCFSACTDLYLAGSRRYAYVDAQFGFHGGAFDGLDVETLQQMQIEHYDYLISAGVTAEFASRASGTPSSELWIPSIQELLQANVVTDVLFPAPDSLSIDEYWRLVISTQGLERTLQDIVSNNQAVLPLQIDEITSFSEISAEGGVLTRIFDISFPGWRPAANFGKLVRAEVCADPYLSQYLFYGAQINEVYRAPPPALPLAFSISETDCPTESN